MEPFFVYDPMSNDSFQRCASHQQALDIARAAVQCYRDEDGEWLEGVEDVCIGLVTGAAALAHDGEYHLEDRTQLPPEPVVLDVEAAKLVDLLKQARGAMSTAVERLASDRRNVGVVNQIRGVLRRIDEVVPPPAAPTGG